ncbi:MAG: hypothetical protein LBV12_12585 [Puniceicoccales bacterium]|nr:hypothetical protein [Puniceicoccales bacterium]
MKQAIKRKFAGIGVAVLILAILVIWGSLYDDKMQVTLPDGTIVKIVKVEVTKTPRYDPRSPLQKTGEWLNEYKWGRSILKVFGIKPPRKSGIFEMSDQDHPVFFVWYTLSDPKKGFFPEEVDRVLAGNRSSSRWGSGNLRDKASLISSGFANPCETILGGCLNHFERP